MKISDALKAVRVVRYPGGAPPVYRTVAETLAEAIGAVVEEAGHNGKIEWTAGGAFDAATEGKTAGTSGDGPGVFRIESRFDDAAGGQLGGAVSLRLGPDGAGRLAATAPRFLFAFTAHLLDGLSDRDVETVSRGAVYPVAFSWQRATYDFFLTQEGRIQKDLDPETYVRRLAESGFTHAEVNGLASPMALEKGPRGEAYPMFYTYCPALDQFVASRLNSGLYPGDYLSANLAALKRNAALALKYGLVPGLLCFEPRSVPEAFFNRYPMLRGARVDHPFRSFKPRYTMTTAHPLVLEHYRDMLVGLMRAVPELGFLDIWTNDSGAGFEHTRSLYVGRNGGAYLIREWRGDDDIATAAGENALRFFRTLRDAAREVNPGFRVITRMESFYGEHDTVWAGMGDGLDVETVSLAARGWEMPYTHPRYPDTNAINGGSVYQQAFDESETTAMADLERRGARAHFHFAAGPHALFGPLLGVPYPGLTWKRLRLLHEGGVRHLALLGGTQPPGLVPFNVNHEILRTFQFDPGMDVGAETERLARRWAGERLAPALIEAWTQTEEAILAFPNITPLYSTHGFTWYRLWVRPFIPDIEALPLRERAYYQDFMCTTPHNPNNVDLSRDVLFRLTTPEKSRLDVERMDQHLWDPLDRAIGVLGDLLDEARGALGTGNVIEDQHVRLRALRCWFITQRSVAAWVAGVYGYMDADSAFERAGCRTLLRDMMEKEIANAEALADLFDSGVAFMSLTDQGETPLIHGTNLKALFEKRAALMRAHIDDEPRFDPDYIVKNAGNPST